MRQIFVTVDLPAVGQYGLEIYGCELLRDGDVFTHVCQYLVVFTDRDISDVHIYDQDLLDRLDPANDTDVRNSSLI